MKNIPSAYNPADYEGDIYKKWLESDYFNPDTHKKLFAEPFSIMMPPPNVTGILHLGHALENSLMDVMARYQRMNGKQVLLLPGTDHAAVATQARVEKNLIAEGMAHPREELGRQKLLNVVRDYAEKSKSTIISQIKRMGTSCDWSRLAYTFDDERSLAVSTIFERMYSDGLIYRGYRVVNWSVVGQSTCSDDELESLERKAKFWTFKYSHDFPFAIATTRPETKLGDTAVAVNPNDERYKDYIGKTFEVNFVGDIKLKLKVIADEGVDPAFGTGALGVTPAHSSVDFEMYEKQKANGDPIELIPVINTAGKIESSFGEFAGLTVEQAREKVVEQLQAQGLLISEEEITQTVGTSDRFGDVVESLPMTQWFVNVNKEIPGKDKTLKDLMREAVTTGLNGKEKIKITPERFEKNYLNWIDKLHDWCISRQVWWGHRIPVWYCKKCNEKICVAQPPTTFIFHRHGECVGNTTNILNADPNNHNNPLTTQGRQNIEDAMIRLKDTKFAAIYASPLQRTQESAKMFSERFDLPVNTDERLKEVGVGEFEGKDNDDFVNFRTSFSMWEKDSPRGIESFESLRNRVYDFMREMGKNHPGETILVFSHGDVLRVVQGFQENLTNEQIYAFTYPDPGQSVTVKTTPVTCHCGSTDVYQDADTLDTWFSSGLWTFSTLGWPNKTKDLKTYHPTTWMQMGHELLFFWLARMVLMTTYALDEIPFKDVYIHGILRDDKGRKFSKSLGNGIDPIEMIEKYGTDALRLSLLVGNTPGNDARFYLEKIEGTRNFVNKLWNISRYIITSLEDKQLGKVEPKTLADQWILARVEEVKKQVENNFAQYDFSAAAETLRNFTWSDLADWYLEIAKVEKDKEAILFYVLKTLVTLWHPFLPFVTEAIWALLDEKESLMMTEWPKAEKKFVNEDALVNFARLQAVVTGIRNVRSAYHVDPITKVSLVVKNDGNLIRDNQTMIQFLARVENLIWAEEKPAQSASLVVSGVEAFIPLAELVDVEQEKVRLADELENVVNYQNSLNKKLNNEEFVKNAPENIITQEKQKLADANEKQQVLTRQLEELK